MAKKKKSSTPTVVAEPVTAKPAPEEEEEEEEGEEEEEMELLQVDVGDIVKLKQILDETVAGALLDEPSEHGYALAEDHFLDNIKLTIMTVACLFAAAAQFSPQPFPDCRPTLGICCVAYFTLSGILQLITTFIDKDCIMITKPVSPLSSKVANKDMAKYGIRVRTSLPRFSEFYSVTLQFHGKENSEFVKGTWSVGQFFDVEGMFDEEGLMEEVEKLFDRFERGRFDADVDESTMGEKVTDKKKKA